MKKITLFASALLGMTFYSSAQEAEEKVDVTVTHEKCENFIKTPPLRDLLEGQSEIIESDIMEESRDRHASRASKTAVADLGIPENNNIDPAAQFAQGGRDGGQWMKVNWQAMSGSGYPPDPTGAVGPDHFVQAVNSSYRVYNKDGSAASISKSLNSLWPSANGAGDPIVMYDSYAERWFISQFSDPSSPPWKIYIAVSETADPLGSYFLYTFNFGSSASQFPDYPKFGVWSNAYFMSCNSSSNDCSAFERDKMLLGDASASKITMSFPFYNQYFNSACPAYADGPTAPDADEPFYFFAVQDNSWGYSAITTDHIKVLKATIDWTSPSSSSVVIHQSINTTAFNSVFNTSAQWEDINQHNNAQKLDAIAGIFMYRAQYRRFDGYNVVMLCQTVDVDGTDRAGIRWYELRDNNDGQWSIFQQGTYAPDATNSRWLGSISMDAQGNIGLAYSFAGPSDYAGLRFTGRYKDDPLGQMTVQEQIAIEGTGAQTVTERYGDYSQLTVDPANDMTFWYTGEYLGSGGGTRTRIFSFSAWTMLGENEFGEPVQFFNAYQPEPNTLRLIWNNIDDQEITATLTDMQGKQVASSKIASSVEKEEFDITSLATGIYMVNISGATTNLSKKIYIAY